ncbi:MAG: hypothetical protein KJZ96_07385 [Rhodocyclaceae bacterium]|nr:hypothetical protein [Rhodocyclaceae bacterium]
MNSVTYTYFLSGQSPYMRVAIDAIGSELDPVLVDTDWHESSEPMKSNKALHLDSRPTMDAGIASGLIVGLSLFVGGWAGNKLLDEIYEEKLRGPLLRLLSKIFQKAMLPSCKRIEYQHVVTLNDIGLTVLVRLLLSNEKEIPESLDRLAYVHKLASDWIEKNGKCAPIHCYVIADGRCNVEPNLYNSLAEIQREERGRVIRKIMGDHET